MPESKQHYFYLWRNRFLDDSTDSIISRTCFGITTSPNKRKKAYEGHVGHTVNFDHLWTGPKRLILELESKIKSDFFEYRFVGTDQYRYEWINETVPFESIVKWVQWEVDNTFDGISEETLNENA